MASAPLFGYQHVVIALLTFQAAMWDLFTYAIYKNLPNGSSHDYYFKNPQSLFFKKNICVKTLYQC